MFQQRQLNDLYQLMEVSFTAPQTGTITSGSRGNFTGIAAFISGSANSAAQFNIGDALEVSIPASAGNMAGLLVQAWPTGQGGLTIGFFNSSGGNITFTNTVFRIIAKRVTAQLL